ncbi:hypothetical protein SAMN06265827_105128 [Orenia metallireducens]|uniref:Uncharacterized protein n=1 Tax=Orenia metallireducens TaxID=1413210 RepID=A0A285G7B2_9FIRM|nr:hypothetical protein [Orenia metallireducens]SNY19472.1 hypothetical protein SAMN06265827_105128 [Orenia metallireducens]
MRELLSNQIVLYVIGFVGIAGLAYLVHRFKRARLLAYALVMYAEEVFESEEGSKKKKLVITKVYEMIPSKISWLISEKRIEKWIDKALDELADYLDNGKLDNSNMTVIEKANNELYKMRLKNNDNKFSFKINGKF